MDAAPKDVAMVANPMKKAPATSPSGSGTPPALASPSSAVDAAASEASEDAVGLQAGLVKGDAASSSSSSATASRVAARVPRVPLVPPPTAPPPREEQAPARAAGFAFVMIGLLSALVALAAFAMALSATIAVAGQSNGAASAAAETTEAWGSHLADFTSLRGHMPLNFNQLADIPTAGARDSEWFTIDGELYLAFANDKDDYSTIWRFRRTDRAFVLVQRVATKNAHDVDVIALGGETYLTYGCKGGTTSSYKWTKSTSTFVHHQTLRDGLYIRDVDHFEYVGEHWLILVVSEKVDATSGDKTNSANSELFKWDASAKVWDFEQYLPSVGARDAEFYVVDNVGCIAIANTKGDPATIRTLNSNIYRWDGTRFVSTGAADIMTKGNYDFEYFEIQTRCKDAGTGVVRVENASFMAAAFSTDETGARSLDSKIYKWKGWSGGEWVEYQNIPTHGARDWEFFQLPTNEFSGADPSGVDLTGKEGTFASSGKVSWYDSHLDVCHSPPLPLSLSLSPPPSPPPPPPLSLPHRTRGPRRTARDTP